MRIKRSHEGGRGRRRKRSPTRGTRGANHWELHSTTKGLANLRATKTSRIIVVNRPVTTARHYVSQPLSSSRGQFLRECTDASHRIGKRLDTRS